MLDSAPEKPKPQTFRVLVFLVVEKDGNRGHLQSYDKQHENPLTALVDLSEAMEVSFPMPTNHSIARIEVTHGSVLVSFRAFKEKWHPIMYPYDDGLRARTPLSAPSTDPAPTSADPAAVLPK